MLAVGAQRPPAAALLIINEEINRAERCLTREQPHGAALPSPFTRGPNSPPGHAAAAAAPPGTVPFTLTSGAKSGGQGAEPGCGRAGCPPTYPRAPLVCPWGRPVPLGDPRLRSRLGLGEEADAERSSRRCPRGRDGLGPSAAGTFAVPRATILGVPNPGAGAGVSIAAKGEAKQSGLGINPPPPSKARSLELGCSRGGWVTALAVNKNLHFLPAGGIAAHRVPANAATPRCPARAVHGADAAGPPRSGSNARQRRLGRSRARGGVPGRAGGVTPTCSQPRFSFLFCQAMIYGPFPAAPPPPRPLQKIIIQEQRRKLDLLPRAAPGPAVGAGFVLTSVSSWRRRLISGGIPPSSRCSADSAAQKGPREPGAAGAFRDTPTPPGRVRPGRGAHGARGGFQARCRTRLQRGAGWQRRSPAPPPAFGLEDD